MSLWQKRLGAAALSALAAVLALTIMASTSRINTTMTRPAAPHEVTWCHPTRHGACWLWTCCLPH